MGWLQVYSRSKPRLRHFLGLSEPPSAPSLVFRPCYGDAGGDVASDVGVATPETAAPIEQLLPVPDRDDIQPYSAVVRIICSTPVFRKPALKYLCQHYPIPMIDALLVPLFDRHYPCTSLLHCVHAHGGAVVPAHTLSDDHVMFICKTLRVLHYGYFIQ